MLAMLILTLAAFVCLSLWVLLLLLVILLLILLMLEVVVLLHMGEGHLVRILVVLLTALLCLADFFIEFWSFAHDDSHLDYVCQGRLSSGLFDLERYFL